MDAAKEAGTSASIVESSSMDGAADAMSGAGGSGSAGDDAKGDSSTSVEIPQGAMASIVLSER